MDVQLAICCGLAARARKPPPVHPKKPHRKNGIFKMPGPRTAVASPGTSSAQTLSFRDFQWDLQKTSSNGTMTPCSAFVVVQNETTRVEVATACLTHWPKIITLPYLRPSPQAVLLHSKQGAHYQTASLEADPQSPSRLCQFLGIKVLDPERPPLRPATPVYNGPPPRWSWPLSTGRIEGTATYLTLAVEGSALQVVIDLSLEDRRSSRLSLMHSTDAPQLETFFLSVFLFSGPGEEGEAPVRGGELHSQGQCTPKALVTEKPW
ncbi:hypothetical protein Q5P01_010748 [Channa striata]|uniref:Uncharacterized protein n=1 Tax=Channa striata TaxID=64152 RepID=A0AA88MTD6_CHASR|nr:hypothetical protein Q5P01_010748 [Channa striata]